MIDPPGDGEATTACTLTTLLAAAKADHRIRVRTVAPARSVTWHWPPPVPAPALDALVVQHWQSVPEPAHLVGTIEGGVVHGRARLIGDDRGHLFYDALPALHRLTELGFRCDCPFPTPPDFAASATIDDQWLGVSAWGPPIVDPLPVSGKAVMLGLLWDHNYFHWVLETLPRLSLLNTDERREATLLAYGPPSRFMTETLRLAGLDRETILWLGERSAHVEHLVFPSRLNRSGFVSRQAVAWVRQTFLGRGTRMHQRFSRGGLRLYVSRADASSRRLRNEAEVMTALAARGFTSVRAGELSVREQRNLFAQASEIVAPHGAALTNMVFASPGARILELFSASYPNPSYWSLAHACGHLYQPLVGDSADDQGDFSVDPAHVLALLER